MGFSNAAATAILQLDEHYNGKGHPTGLRGQEISPLARIACLAQTVEVFYANLGRDAALSVVSARSGKWFDPQLVRALTCLPPDDRLWTELASPRTPQDGRRVRVTRPGALDRRVRR